ncbi:DinB family protein [Neobacillus sp. NPDC058068]|uniref:DinB family protein n=1 Tax=Neobacillus sp. NPDC058068 TaxID=3346325 RepID=UPI0036DC5629
MNEESKMIIGLFNDYATWVETLKDLDGKVWGAPISEGKWSISEIISHIMNWDHHLLLQVLPSVEKGEGMEFPEFDTFNKVASDYAQSGISQVQLIEEAVKTRESLVSELLKMPLEKLTLPLPSNGISHCPYTGEPYSLLYIVKEFSEHDTHHKQQIMEFLNKISLV